MNQLWIELVNMIAGGTSNRHFTAAITYLTLNARKTFRSSLSDRA